MLVRTPLAKGLSILDYNPYLTERAEVDQQLASSDIEAIPIDDMRGRIIELVDSPTENVSRLNQHYDGVISRQAGRFMETDLLKSRNVVTGHRQFLRYDESTPKEKYLI